MPIPLIPVFVAAGAGVAWWLGRPVTDGLTQLRDESGRSTFPYQQPPVDLLLSALGRGVGDHNLILQSLRAQGIRLFHNEADLAGEWRTRLWRQMMPLYMLSPSIESVLHAHYRGYLLGESFAEAMLRAGAELPRFRPIIEAARPRLSVAELIAVANRIGMPDPALRGEIKIATGLDDADVSRIANLRWITPTPSDAIHFAIRDVFDPEKLGLDEMRVEFDKQRGLKELMRASGVGPIDIPGLNAARVGNDPAFWHWVASYQEVSPTQVFEMLHRLRPGRVPPELEVVAISPDPQKVSVEKLLKEVDYNPIWRQRLAAISYRTLPRVDVRRAYRNGIFGPRVSLGNANPSEPAQIRALGPAANELVELNQDNGLTERDAARMAAFTIVDEERTAGGTWMRLTRTKIMEGLRLGAFDEAFARRELARLMPVPQDVERTLLLLRLEDQLQSLKVFVDRVRRQFMRGELDRFQADAELTITGMDIARRDWHINQWMNRLIGERRELRATQVVKHLVMGVINADEARRRLTNLRYAPDDINLLLAGALVEINRAQARFAERQIKASRQAAREQMQEAARQAAEAERLRKLALGRAGKADLLRWLRKGIISVAEASVRLIALGFRPEDADRLIQENSGGQPAESPNGDGGEGPA